MKFKKNLLLIVLSFWLVFSLWNFSYAKEYEYKSLDIKANVEIDWTIDVKETFDTNFLVRKHWIIRSIPLNYSVEEKDFHIDISNVYVGWLKFVTSKNGWDFEIKIWDANKTVIWKQIYPISYSVYWLIRNFSWMWYSELYWNIVWYDFDTNIGSVKAEIELPKKNSFSSSDFLITVDWKEKTVWTFAWKVDWSQWDKIIITYDRRLSAGEWITFAVKFPNDYFVFDHDKQASLIWYVWWNWTSSTSSFDWSWSFLKIMAIVVWLIVVVGSIFRSVFTRILGIFTHNNGSYIHKSEIEKDLNKESPIVVKYAPPEWVNCAEAGMLYNCILEPTDLTSLLYKWVVEWLISLRIEESVNFEKIDWFIMTKLKNIEWSYPSYEVKFFNYLLPWEINSRKSISKSSALEVSNSLKSLRDYGRSKWWITVWLFSDNIRYIWIFWGVVLFIILFFMWASLETAIILSFFIISLFSKKSDFPTQKRISLTDEWKKIALDVIWYAKFIQVCDENKLRLFLKRDPAFFDKTLPYAVAFWFETSFIKKITPLLRELDVKPVRYNGDLYEMNSISSIVNDAIREQELRKQREKERERRSTYDRSSWFSSGSSFSFWWFSRWWWGWWWGSRSW